MNVYLYSYNPMLTLVLFNYQYYVWELLRGGPLGLHLPLPPPPPVTKQPISYRSDESNSIQKSVKAPQQ